jgi:hypothetical protein
LGGVLGSLRSGAKLGLSVASLGLGAAVAGGLMASAAQANTTGYTVSRDGRRIEIWGTGRNADNTAPVGGTGALSGAQSVPENFWKLVAFPNAYVDTDLATPGNLFIPNKVPAGWADQTGGNNTPVDGYRWITYADWANNGSAYGSKPPSDAYATSYFRSGQPGVDFTGLTSGFTPSNGTNPDYYSYIARTTFTAARTGYYKFETTIAADNFIEVFLGGSISMANAGKQPTIVGGQKLAQLAADNASGLFATPVYQSGFANLVAGETYELNYVIRDNCSGTSVCNFGQTGFLVGSTAFSEVPAPLPILGAVAFFHQSRRLRRRLARKSS